MNLKRILCLTASVPYRAYVADLAASFGGSFTVTDSCDSGLRTIKESGPFDLVVIDDNLPDAGPLEVTMLVHNIVGEVPIVFMADGITDELRWELSGMPKIGFIAPTMSVEEAVTVVMQTCSGSPSARG